MMSQLSDLIGVSRQATVMAFQFGDGFTNIITPASGVLLGALSMAKISYDKWVYVGASPCCNHYPSWVSAAYSDNHD